MTELRIVFMGTPEFAVPSLEILVENNFRVVAVITAPDKPQGRGQKLVHSPVKECGLRLGIPVLQPTNLKAAEFQSELRNFNANLQVVVAFRMLPEAIWSMPSLGTFNLHASLLPQYRGAAPIHWAIINGETETGVTTFFLQHEIDTGRIIFQEKEPVLAEDTVGSLYERLKIKGGKVVLKTVQAIANGTAPSTPQPLATSLRSAPKIFKETCELHWTDAAEQVRNKVRGLSPYPAAWCTLNEKIFKILSVSLTDSSKNGSPGDLDTDEKTYVRVCTTKGWIAIEELQPEGKRKMKIREFLAGNKI